MRFGEGKMALELTSMEVTHRQLEEKQKSV
jgi:hypothetical protein